MRAAGGSSNVYTRPRTPHAPCVLCVAEGAGSTVGRADVRPCADRRARFTEAFRDEMLALVLSRLCARMSPPSAGYVRGDDVSGADSIVAGKRDRRLIVANGHQLPGAREEILGALERSSLN